jgi:hypothetical protein
LKMKRVWLVLLLLGLLTVFSTSAMAVDVKFSGEMYVAGAYLDRVGLTKDPGSADKGFNTAFFYQRLRVQTDFIVSPGLSLTTRVDALERVWGGPRNSPGSGGYVSAVDSAATQAENENFAVDWAYINYASPIGIFAVGIMNDGATGTIFGNSYAPAGRIKYSYTISPVTINLAYTKVRDTSYTAYNTATTWSDGDQDKYGIEGVFTWKDGKAGMNINYYRYADTRPATIPPPNQYQKTYFIYTPYVFAKIGSIDLQAELNYATGKARAYDDASLGSDIKIQNFSGWVDATATFGPVYFGGSVAYVSGDDPTTSDVQEGGTLNGGRDWSPTLLMWNWDRSYWIGTITSTAVPAANGFGSSFANGILYQGRVGVRPISQLDVMASLTYAAADKKPTGYVGGSYGWEADLVGTYKITNNLSYMLGLGYLWTGDYFKGASATAGVVNDFIVTNKLTLTF